MIGRSRRHRIKLHCSDASMGCAVLFVHANSIEDLQARDLVTGNAGPRLALIAESCARLTGKTLVQAGENLADALWTAPKAILAHGVEADPIFFYGNRLALWLFEVPAESFVRMPSRLSAEAAARQDRARLLERVGRDGYIDDYSGVRVSASGRRFLIDRALVWNLRDHDGRLHGQAASFACWTAMD